MLPAAQRADAADVGSSCGTDIHSNQLSPRAFAPGEGNARQFQIVRSCSLHQAARMRTRSTISGSELLLGVIAIRLAMLVLVGLALTLLPQQANESNPACFSSSATESEAQLPAKTVGPRIADAALDDMLLHD